MRKKLLFICILIITSLSGFSANFDLSLAELGAGWSSSYNPETKTITFDGEWTGRGWWFDSKDFTGYSEVVVEFEPVDFDVQLMIEYNGGVAGGKIVASAGATSVKLALDADGKADVQQIYLQNSAVGTLTLKAAYVVGETSGEAVKEDLSLADLGSGWGDSSYDAATKTITFVGDWTGRGWWFDSKDLSAYDKVVVTFEPADMQLKLVVEYSDGSSNTPEVYANAGESSMTVMLDSEKKSNVKQIYIQSASAGTVVLTGAYLEGAASGVSMLLLDFEGDELGYSYNITGTGAATVVENPAKSTEKSLQFKAEAYDSYCNVKVKLADGFKFSDITSIAFDTYATASNWKEILINVNGDFIYKTGTYPQVLFANSWNTVEVKAENFYNAAGANISEVDKTKFEDLTEFTLGLGLNDNNLTYWMDNIKLSGVNGEISKIISGIDSFKESMPIYVSNGALYIKGGYADALSIYDLQGRICSEANGVSSVDISNLAKGVYVVKASINGKIQVEKFVK